MIVLCHGAPENEVLCNFTVPHSTWLGSALLLLITILLTGFSICLLVVALHKKKRSFEEAAKWSGLSGGKKKSNYIPSDVTKVLTLQSFLCVWWAWSSLWGSLRQSWGDSPTSCHKRSMWATRMSCSTCPSASPSLLSWRSTDFLHVDGSDGHLDVLFSHHHSISFFF